MSRGDGLARLRQALEDHGCTVRGNSAQCPGPDHANGDRRTSLSIGQGRDGAILKCHLGCHTDTILEVLGMSSADLFDEPREQGSGAGYQVAAEYRYTDEDGQLLFVKERRVPKDFRLRRPDGRGGWEWGLGDDTRRVLYNLPAVLAAVVGGQPVYVVEGEKDADAIGRAGAVATCNFEGAAKDGQRPKWRPEYGDVLKGATVIVVADKDPAGYAHAAAVKADLTGKAGSVTVVEPAGGKDAADHLAAGHGLGDFVPLPPPLDPAAALARIKKAAESADDEDLVPVAVAAEIAAMAREGMDDETGLAVRVYLAREKKHLGVGPRDLERIIKAEAAAAFREAMQERMRARDNTALSPRPADDAHLHTPPSWASDQDILARMVRVLRVCMGLVGEHRAAKLVYLAITSRLLGEPVNIVIKGLSSSGKSYTIECVARLFPEEAIYTMTAMSERALIYLEEPLEHRTIILYEAVALREGREKAEDNQTAYIVRSLLSEGRIEYPVVIRDEETGRLRTEKLIKPGPTNLVTSTTAVSLHGENETRMISLPSNDSKAQTLAVMLESSEEKKRQAADLGEWHAFQQWLAAGPREVTIPYARCIAAQIPPVAVRLRRDWNAIRSLIKAHAIIHRSSRQADEHGRIVAELADYTAVRSLVNDLIAEAVGSTVPESVRKTVELVQAQTVKADPKDEPPHPDGIKVAKVKEMLKLERSAASRRLKTAADRGYLVNAEDKRGKPARYILGDPMPDEIAVLPEPYVDDQGMHTICTPPCTHTPQDETAGQSCDCTGVCRCADDAGPVD